MPNYLGNDRKEIILHRFKMAEVVVQLHSL